MRLIPIPIARDGLSFSKLKTSKARLTARPHTFLDYERPSLAIYIRYPSHMVSYIYYVDVLNGFDTTNRKPQLI